jgi:hypothetical protein
MVFDGSMSTFSKRKTGLNEQTGYEIQTTDREGWLPLQQRTDFDPHWYRGQLKMGVKTLALLLSYYCTGILTGQRREINSLSWHMWSTLTASRLGPVQGMFRSMST